MWVILVLPTLCRPLVATLRVSSRPRAWDRLMCERKIDPLHRAYHSNFNVQWRIQPLKKEGARLHEIFKLTDFGLSFTLKKVKFWPKRPPPPLNPPLMLNVSCITCQEFQKWVCGLGGVGGGACSFM